MNIEIKNRWTGNIIFSITADSVKLAVKAAIEQKVVLRGAVLRGADLSDAVLRGAVLRGADLSDAVLRG
ncbi:MAG TPA: pentapeptide repeat-containing protein, partial [Verrucomicrobiae bacterium]|nr:pentapeptide repeat-containing protein [Verrucomicrobiae bacterium]